MTDQNVNLDVSNTGEISQDQMVAMLLGGEVPTVNEGDTAAKSAESGVPEAAPEEKKPEPEQAPESEAKTEPVILAKDGVHTIEYQKLVDAREEAKAWKQKAEEISAALQAKESELAAKLMTAKQTDAANGNTVAEDELQNLFKDFPELEEGVRKLVDARMTAIEAKLAPIAQKTEEAAALSAEESHFKAIGDKHADWQSVVESQEFGKWMAAQPSFVRESLQRVCDGGTAPQVIEMLDTYKEATGLNKPADTPKQDVAGKAQEVVAKAKATPPNSLSDIPAGAAAHHDEAEAIREMNPMALLGKFEGKSPDQILSLMSRVI